MLRFRLSHSRLSRSPFTFWLAVGVLALVTGSVMAQLVGQAEALSARYGPLRPVVVAARAVDRGAELASADVAVKHVSAGFLPEGTFTTAKAVVGRTPVVPLLAGQTVLAGHLAPDGLVGVTALLPAGSRAVAVPSGGASPPVRRGDTVDVLATFDPQVTGAGDPTLTVAVDALVVDVGADSATVAVTPEQAKAVAFAVSHGTITVAITPGARGQRNEVASTPSTAAPPSRR